MARNWAIVVGINQYSTFLSPLKYAKQDAELMRDLFQELDFDEICLFTEDSPPQRVGNKLLPTYPSYGNLHGFLWEIFKDPFLSIGDNLWFFFAGHGMQYSNRDYLMLIDTHPSNIAATGICVDYIQERLTRSGADNVILLLDACRNRGYRGIRQIGREAQQGIITIFSCSPDEVSWEVDEIQHGVFTYCLDEALNPRKGHLEKLKCTTVEKLNAHLCKRVPFVCEWYKRFPVQVPYTRVAPLEKAHLILLPKYAQSEDIEKLHEDAHRAAFTGRNLDFAEELCIRANEAAQGKNEKVLNLLEQLQQKQLEVGSFEILDLPLRQIIHRLKDSRSAQVSALREQVSKVIRARIQGHLLEARCFLSRQIQSISRILKSLYDDIPASTNRKILSWLGVLGLSFMLIIKSLPSEPSSSSTDYTYLKHALQASIWKEADQETVDLILKATRKTSQIALTKDDISQISCDILRDVDQLWVQNSSGRFGFSVQRKLYFETANLVPGFEISEIFEMFRNRVGWNTNEIWTSNSSPAFSEEPPPGHFPQASLKIGFLNFVQKLSACQL